MCATGSIPGNGDNKNGDDWSGDERRRIAMTGMGWGDEFAGKKVVLTGACGIYGRWIADSFVAAGARLCLSDRGAEGLDALDRELGVRAGGGVIHVTELTDA